MLDIRIPVTVGGVTFKNPFYVASGPTTKTVKQLVRIEECGWAAASIKLSIDPAPYINRKPRYDLFEDRNALAFTTEKRLSFQEGLTLVREAKKVLNDLVLFANITYAGEEGVSGWVNMAVEFEKAGADIIELNMCCPNMSFNVSLTTAGQESTTKQTGASLGQDEDAVTEIVRAIKKEINIPLFVKLTPEGGRIAPIAKALYDAGADAVSGTGNRMAMPVIDLVNPSKAVYHLQEEISMSCYSGAWLKPLAQRDTYEIRKLCGNDAKLAATGGITNWRDAVEMVMCGGNLLGVCAETLINGFDIVRPMIKGLHNYMQEHGYATLDDFSGIIVPHVKTAQEVTLYSGYAKIKNPKLSGSCKVACPHHVPVQAYVQSVGRGDFKKAYEIITEKGLLQSACAYICPNPCEDACVRGAYGSPVRIRELKRYVLEKGRAEGWVSAKPKAKANGRRVAVIGGGAAGISAATELSHAGYGVTIFEKESEIGGSLRGLASGGQMPEEVLAGIISSLKISGVKICTEATFGRNINAERLFGEGFSAVFLAFREEELPELFEASENEVFVENAASLLNGVESEQLAGKRIAIFGTGIYSLRSALAAFASGAESVCLIGHFNRKQSAEKKLLLELETKGALVLESFQPSATEEKDGVLCELRLIGAHGVEMRLPCDRIFAIPITVSAAPTQEGVFTIGDTPHAAVNVIRAAAQGVALAAKIDRFLLGDGASLGMDEKLTPAKRDVVLARTGALPLEKTVGKPISSDDEAIAEAVRCLGCGCGEGCQLCKTICTDFAPVIAVRDELAIVPEECVACGMCLNRCPNGNIEMVNTGQKV